MLQGREIYEKSVDVNGCAARWAWVFLKAQPFPMSIYDNVAYGPRLHGSHSKAELDELVEQSLGAAL